MAHPVACAAQGCSALRGRRAWVRLGHTGSSRTRVHYYVLVRATLSTKTCRPKGADLFALFCQDRLLSMDFVVP